MVTILWVKSNLWAESQWFNRCRTRGVVSTQWFSVSSRLVSWIDKNDEL